MKKDKGIEYLASLYGADKVEDAVQRICDLAVEAPSWAFGRGGTRFAIYRDGSEPASLEERLRAAGKVYKLTGRGRTVALHFPWDGQTAADVEKLKQLLAANGLAAGAVNPNLFTMRPPLGAALRLGSLANPEAAARAASVEHCLWCLEAMRTLGSRILSVWLPDGSNSPGQASLYEQADMLEEGLKQVQRALRPGELMLLEYKFFEPAFYATGVFDWGRALDICRKLGDNVQVLVDLGHHAHGVLVEQVVAMLVREGRLGGFHLNDSNYADDDLAAGSINASRLWRVFVVLLEGQWRGLLDLAAVALMIDQSHNVKHPVAEIVETLINIEVAYARALLVDYDALDSARRAGKPTMADAALYAGFNADVRPLLAEARRRRGLPPEPLAALGEA